MPKKEGLSDKIVSIEQLRRARAGREKQPETNIPTGNPAIQTFKGTDRWDIETIASSLGAQNPFIFRDLDPVELALLRAPSLLPSQNSRPAKLTFLPQELDQYSAGTTRVSLTYGDTSWIRVSMKMVDTLQLEQSNADFSSEGILHHNLVINSDGNALATIKSPLIKVAMGNKELNQAHLLTLSPPPEAVAYGDPEKIANALGAENAELLGDDSYKFHLPPVHSHLYKRPSALPTFTLKPNGYPESFLNIPYAQYSSGESMGLDIELGDASRIFVQSDRIIICGFDDLINWLFLLRSDGQAAIAFGPTPAARERYDRTLLRIVDMKKWKPESWK